MSESKFESTFEPRCDFSCRFPLHPCTGFLRKPVYGPVLACPFAFHPLSFPVISSSLPELWDTGGDGRCKLEQLYPSVKCLESSICLRYGGERRRGERSRQGEVHDEGQDGEQQMT